MKNARRKSKEFYFSVEGETEKWYLEWLQKLINASEEKTNNAVFRIKKAGPISFAKDAKVPFGAKVNHFFDYEGIENESEFIKVLDKMREAEELGKGIEYVSCYSNLTFELWIILNTDAPISSMDNKNGYLPIINKVFEKSYEGLKEYKEEKHFKAILALLTLDDVKAAVLRAEEIMKSNSKNKTPVQHKKWKWYRDNPSTEVGAAIKDILRECGLM